MSGARRAPRLAIAAPIIACLWTARSSAAQTDESQRGDPAPQSTSAAEDSRSSDALIDSKDGWFDISRFLDSRVGFFPVVFPITEPAVGYGGGGALAFFHTPPRAIETENGTRVVPPIATIVLGAATDNGSWGAGGAHMHNWDDGSIRYTVGGGYASLNLDWFGHSNEFAGQSFSYNIAGAALFQKLVFKLGDSDFFLGPTQRLLTTTTKFNDAASLPPDITPAEQDTTVSGLGIAFAYDTRNSYFSPTRGTRASLDFTQNDHVIGSDFDYGRANLELCQYVPLGGPYTLGVRGDLEYASETAPFFDLASVGLRGIAKDRYVDNVALTLETEARWDIARWTLVGFAGVGWTADKLDAIETGDGHWAGGAGFRYLIAREYDMRVGADLAHGPDGWAFYLTVGTGWLRD